MCDDVHALIYLYWITYPMYPQEVHWRLYENDVRAFRIWMQKSGYHTIREAFHNLIEIRTNQPPARMEI